MSVKWSELPYLTEREASGVGAVPLTEGISSAASFSESEATD